MFLPPKSSGASSVPVAVKPHDVMVASSPQIHPTALVPLVACTCTAAYSRPVAWSIAATEALGVTRVDVPWPNGVPGTSEMNVPSAPGYGAAQGVPSRRLKHLSHTPPSDGPNSSTVSTARAWWLTSQSLS